MLAKTSWGSPDEAADELEHLCSSTVLFSYRAHLAGEGINLGVTPNGTRCAPALGCLLWMPLLKLAFLRSRVLADPPIDLERRRIRNQAIKQKTF